MENFAPHGPEYFLGEGEFSRRDSVIREAVEELMTYRVGYDFTGDRAKVEKVRMFFRRKFGKPEYIFGGRKGRERTASDVIREGYFVNCIDFALVFSTLVREVGIPAKYVETFVPGKLARGKFKIHGFVDLFVEGEWKSYSPGEGFTYHNGVYFFGGDVYKKLAEGLDFSELYFPGGEGPAGVYTREGLERRARALLETARPKFF